MKDTADSTTNGLGNTNTCNVGVKRPLKYPLAPRIKTVDLPEDNSLHPINIRTGEGDQINDNLLLSST
ncbi:hypothetical protein Agabi119p4_9338 [Agaricus bisporus var. burnettii]|uniref:Uncharacterized protein n=1 Tax=Agaricus bisporus var. burnettii TaxID=192524 RepID=A0A8H7C3K2_AGABI|nr:hypothetical protein Agabi119p4_9338 [Agaricus bisporus var. burnettii]